MIWEKASAFAAIVLACLFLGGCDKKPRATYTEFDEGRTLVKGVTINGHRHYLIYDWKKTVHSTFCEAEHLPENEPGN